MYQLPEQGDKLEALYCLRHLTDGAFSRVLSVRITEPKTKQLAGQLFGTKELVAKFDTGGYEDSDLAKEVRLLKRVTHPNVIRCTPLLFTTNRNSEKYRFSLMQRFRGDLFHFLAQRAEELEKQDTISLMRQIASGLLSLHQNNIVHGDVKGENVLVDWTGIGKDGKIVEVKVADLGSAFDFGVNPPDLPEYGHTPNKASPEVVTGVCIGPHVDVFSLGCLYSELRTFSPLFPYKDDNHTLLDHLHAIRQFSGNEDFYPKVAKCLDFFTFTGSLQRAHAIKEYDWRYLNNHMEPEEIHLVRSTTHPNWTKRPTLSHLISSAWSIKKKRGKQGKEEGKSDSLTTTREGGEEEEVGEGKKIKEPNIQTKLDHGNQDVQTELVRKTGRQDRIVGTSC